MKIIIKKKDGVERADARHKIGHLRNEQMFMVTVTRNRLPQDVTVPFCLQGEVAVGSWCGARLCAVFCYLVAMEMDIFSVSQVAFAAVGPARKSTNKKFSTGVGRENYSSRKEDSCM